VNRRVKGHRLIAAMIAVGSCYGPAERPPTKTQDSIAITRDSAAAATDKSYQAELARFRHDEAIIDSIERVARLDPILKSDSLYRVFRWALRPQGVSVADVNVLSCLEIALDIRYGLAAAGRVMKELRDTVFRDKGISDGVEFYWSRAPNQGRLDTETCPREQNPHPDAIDGTLLDAEPTPPRRARGGV
jgi:hypothetical protein